MPRPARKLLLICMLLAAACGCSSKSASSTVSGSVKLDGAPLPSGRIQFIAADGASPNADAVITDGKYTAAVPPGDKRIEILAPKIIGKKKMYDTPDSPTVDIVKELLPARYNVQSELKMTVAAGEQEKSFALQSK